MVLSVGDEDECRYSENAENLGNMLISKVESIDFFPGSNPGDNYMSVVKRILVKGRNRADNSGNFCYSNFF